MDASTTIEVEQPEHHMEPTVTNRLIRDLPIFKDAAVLGLNDIAAEGLRQALHRVTNSHLSAPNRSIIEELGQAMRGRHPEWGPIHYIRDTIARTLVTGGESSRWQSSLKSLISLKALIWDGPSDWIAYVHKYVPIERPLQMRIATFENSTCGQGVKQRPVVVFVASMIDFLLLIPDEVNLHDVKRVAKHGLSRSEIPDALDPHTDPPIAGSESGGLTSVTSEAEKEASCKEMCDMLTRCVSVQSYLNYLLAASDLPLLAMDNKLSCDVLTRVVTDIGISYSFLVQNVNVIFSTRLCGDQPEVLSEMRVWKSLFSQFDTTLRRLVQFFGDLRALPIAPSNIPDICVPAAPLDVTLQDMIDGAEADAERQRKAAANRPPLSSSEDTALANAGERSPAPSNHVRDILSNENDYPESENSSATTTLGLTLPFARPESTSDASFKDGNLTDDDTTSTNDEDPLSAFETTSKGRYSIGNVIGQGAYGTVYRAFDNEEGQFVAIKELGIPTYTPEGLSNSPLLTDLRKEFAMLTRTSDPHVVAVKSLDMSESKPRIIMEWMPGGSIQSALKLTKNGFRENVVARFIRQALKGLAYLHSVNIVHRDIKPGNMLLSANGDVKLSDFGTSRVLSEANDSMRTGTVVGTVPYLAPECFQGTYSFACDIWALGCSTLEMLTGVMPWAEKGAKDSLALVFIIGSAQPPDHYPSIPDSCESASPMVPSAEGTNAACGLAGGNSTISSVCRDFLLKCFTYDYKERPSAVQLLEHPFIANR